MDVINGEPMFDENGKLIGISVPALPVEHVVFGTFNSDGTVTPHQPIRKAVAAWECPACGCGVRGDVEVCPNCVKQSANHISVAPGRPRVITEYPYLRSQGLVDENGYLTDETMKLYGIEHGDGK